MKFLILLLSVLIVVPVSGYCQSPPSVKPDDDVTEIASRFRDRAHVSMLAQAMWTVTHDYADHKHMEEVVFKSFPEYMEAMEKHLQGDRAPLEKLGGIAGFREKLVLWLNDPDQAIRAFAAVIAGISRDREIIPHLVKLMNKKEGEERFSRVYDRGRAAMALGFMRAAEYKPDILQLLKSQNEYNRSGAIAAITLLGAKENAKDVAAILTDPALRDSDDASPIYFLVETGTAKDYKKEIVASMLRPFGGEVAEAAMFALVRIRAKEHSADIAKLLTDRSKKGAAAKALALLGATEYTNKIGAMLEGADELGRADAALALGILGAKKYAPKLAAMMRGETFINSYAAAAIIMMDAPAYTAEATKILVDLKEKKVYLTENSFHPLVSEETAPFVQKVWNAANGKNG